jgi:hypothetical protein
LFWQASEERRLKRKEDKVVRRVIREILEKKKEEKKDIALEEILEREVEDDDEMGSEEEEEELDVNVGFEVSWAEGKSELGTPEKRDVAIQVDPAEAGRLALMEAGLYVSLSLLLISN